MDFAKPVPESLTGEFGARADAYKYLIHFTTYTYSRYIAEMFHVQLAQTLQKVVEGKIKRLMIFAPPQHGKSELTSVRFPAFWLGHRDEPIIMCSYGSELANSKAGEAEGVIGSATYRNIFFNRFRDAEEKGWTNKHYTGYLKSRITSAGVGGTITGFGAGLGIIDDPIKSWAEAQSSGRRNTVWNWYRATFRTRIWDQGAIILIMTRWHEDDLAGRLLKSQGNKWTVIRYPAIAETQKEWDTNSEYLGLKKWIGKPDPLYREPGEPLCPIRFNRKALDELKEDVGPLAWTAEYQGVPRAPEGNLIKRKWFQIVEAYELPSTGLTYIRYWDKAGTEGGGARTAGVLMARDKVRNYYVINVTKGQWSEHHREKVIREVAERDKETFGNVTIFVELGGGSDGIDSYKMTAGNLAGFTVRKDNPTKSKLVRLWPFMSQAEAGNIYLIRGAWNWDWLDEMTSIPNNAFWDQADATSGAFKRLTKTGWSLGMEE